MTIHPPLMARGHSLHYACFYSSGVREQVGMACIDDRSEESKQGRVDSR